MAEKIELTFEAALSRLDEILKALEGGDVPLDKSLSLFEEGVTLSNYCNGLLDKAEQKVMILTRDENGALAQQQFTEGGNS